MATNSKQFIYVNDTDIDNFLEYKNDYDDCIAFLGSSGKIYTKGNIYGGSSDEELDEVVSQALNELNDKIKALQQNQSSSSSNTEVNIEELSAEINDLANEIENVKTDIVDLFILYNNNLNKINTISSDVEELKTKVIVNTAEIKTVSEALNSKIISLYQDEYDALEVINPDTLYLIKEED